MNTRNVVLIGILGGIILPCMLLINRVMLYMHPEMSANRADLFYCIGVFIIIVLIAGAATYLLGRRDGNKNKPRTAVLVERNYKSLMEDSGMTAVTLDKDGIIRFVSENILHLTYMHASEFTGLPIQTCVPEEYHATLNEIISNIGRRLEYVDKLDLQVYTKQHERKWVSCKLYPLRTHRNKSPEVVMMLLDITEEKKLQAELHELEKAKDAQRQLMQTVIDFSPAMVYIKQLDGNYILTNSKMKRLVNARHDHGLKEILEEKYPAIIEQDRQQEQILLKTRRMVTYESEFVHENGKVTNFLVQKYPIFNNEGNIESICGFSTDITLFKQSEHLILGAKNEAEQAKEGQEIFMANMSHEIRTPLNGIIGMGNLLSGTEMSPEQTEYLDSIQISAKNLLAIINDILDFSKIKSGKFKLDEADFNPRDVIRKSMYPLLLRAKEKGVALKFFIDTDVPETLHGDQLRFLQMIINLVGNAIKFTPKGSIEVKAHPIARDEQKVTLCIEVKDTGIGIPEDKLLNVFENYEQSDSNIARNYGGTGLGLAIVKQLAEVQGGSISVKSKLGKGSTFTLEIPYKIGQSNPDELIADKDTSGQQPLSDIRILVAEDNTINQRIVQQTLSKQGATVDVAINGEAAVEKLHGNKYDLILMDLQMPIMNGYEATLHIRDVMKIDTPIMAMTANALKEEVMKCYEAGMNDYISKPFEPSDLRDKILRLVQEYKAAV
ncbi:MAG: response regulator [Taibaiella sp.]|nr:response regulator [Taibaiella sp.]